MTITNSIKSSPKSKGLLFAFIFLFIILKRFFSYIIDFFIIERKRQNLILREKRFKLKEQDLNAMVDEHQKNIEQLTYKRNELKEREKTLKQNEREYTERVEALEETIQSDIAQIIKSKEQEWRDDFESENSSLIESNALLNEQNVLTIKRNRSLQEKNRSIVDKKHKVTSELTKYTNKRNRLIDEVKKLEEQAQLLEIEHANLKEESEQFQCIIATWKNQYEIEKAKYKQKIVLLEQEYTELNEDHNLRMNRLKREFKDSYETLNAQYAELKEVNDLKMNRDALKTESEELLENIAQTKNLFKQEKAKYENELARLEERNNFRAQSLESDFNKLDVEYHCRRNAMEQNFSLANDSLQELDFEISQRRRLLKASPERSSFSP